MRMRRDPRCGTSTRPERFSMNEFAARSRGRVPCEKQKCTRRGECCDSPAACCFKDSIRLVVTPRRRLIVRRETWMTPDNSSAVNSNLSFSQPSARASQVPQPGSPPGSHRPFCWANPLQGANMKEDRSGPLKTEQKEPCRLETSGWKDSAVWHDRSAVDLRFWHQFLASVPGISLAPWTKVPSIGSVGRASETVRSAAMSTRSPLPTGAVMREDRTDQPGRIAVTGACGAGRLLEAASHLGISSPASRLWHPIFGKRLPGTSLRPRDSSP
jgi:hypothetical protein